MTAPLPPGGALDGRHVVLGVTGGVAAYKAVSLARAMLAEGATVEAVLTTSARRFVGPATFEGITGRPVAGDLFDAAWRSDHLRLARSADVVCVAPASADLLARAVHGRADDLLAATLLSATCPVVVGPAMHTEMWQHPATRDNVERLRARGVRVVDPEHGELAGGDVGVGRLADEGRLLGAVRAAVGGGALAGRRLVVTAGGTREPIDPVRFLGNRSTGRMGFAVAAEAARRGAHVDLVAGPTHLPDPPGVTVTRVETARQMHREVLDLADRADGVVKAAAVADFRPADPRADKIVKTGDDAPSRIDLERNPDILAELGGRRRPGQVLVGFAAETDDALVTARGKEKLERKGCDLVVANRVGRPDSGFAVDANQAVLLRADGTSREVPLSRKATVASAVIDEVEALLATTGHEPGDDDREAGR